MKVGRILETSLYAQDLVAAEAFYTTVLGLEVHARVPGRHVFFRSGSNMFLIFNPDQTETEKPRWHGCRGRGHVAWAIAENEVDAWRTRLNEAGVPIDSDYAWPNGGHSLYFRDPADNLLELATPSVWGPHA